MTDRKLSLIESLTRTALNAMSAQEVRDCRFGIRPDVGDVVWICLDIIEVPESEGSANKVNKLWAHTNDFDGMVYGWSNCEFSLITCDEQEAFQKVVEFLTGKTEKASRLEATYHRTTSVCLPPLVADTDNQELREPPALPSN